MAAISTIEVTSRAVYNVSWRTKQDSFKSVGSGAIKLIYVNRANAARDKETSRKLSALFSRAGMWYPCMGRYVTPTSPAFPLLFSFRISNLLPPSPTQTEMQ